MSSGPSSERSESGEAPEGRTAFAEPESLGRAANGRSATTEKRGTDDKGGGQTAGEAASGRPEQADGDPAAESAENAGELWRAGPVWTVQSVRSGTAAERTVQAEEAVQPARGGGPALTSLERAARSVGPATARVSVRRSGTARAWPEQAGLEGLYRQTVRGLRPAAPALPPEQAGRAGRAQEPGSAAPLSVEELDRAVRRDSRRYDGGLSIY